MNVSGDKRKLDVDDADPNTEEQMLNSETSRSKYGKKQKIDEETYDGPDWFRLDNILKSRKRKSKVENII